MMQVRRLKDVGAMMCLAALIAAAGAGCGNKASGDEAGGPGAAAGTQKPEFSDDAMAFMMGRKYAFACLYIRLDKAAEAQSSIGAAQTIARALGVTEPTLPTKDGAFAALRAKAIPDAVTAKKGAKLGAVYSLGVAVTDAWFGAMLGSDPKPAVADIEIYAKVAGILESAYKVQLDAMKAKPTEEGLKKLAQDLETHYKGK